MKPSLVALICVLVVVGELAGADSNSEAWRRFKRQYGTAYGDEEDAMRFANFLATKQRIERHNADSSATYKMGLNHMSDWSREEVQQLNGLNFNEPPHWSEGPSNEMARFSAQLAKWLQAPEPEEFDWRKVPNRVSSVKDQRACGSCWAFSTIGLLEGQEALRNISKIISLSAQQLVDCSSNNSGCGGGDQMQALNDIANLMGGIESEKDYKYEAFDGKCRMERTKYVITVKGSKLVKNGDEEELKRVVANYGPVSVSMDAEGGIRDYQSGVYSQYNCSKTFSNHALLLVGYGHDDREGDYWIIKNSWGADWGENGYLRLKRGDNMCGVASSPVVAVF